MTTRSGAEVDISSEAADFAAIRQGGKAMHWLRAVMTVMMSVALAAFVPPSPAARADVVSSVRVAHFTLSGTSERALLAQFMRRGPKVDGRHAFARTRVRARMRATLAGVPGRCVARRLNLTMRFHILLPRAGDEHRFPPAMKRRWRAFLAHLRRHEERHKRIWLDCGREAERRLKGLRAASCRALNRRMKRIYRAVMARCDARHAAFDAREGRRVLRQPFIRAALRRPQGR